MSKCNIQTLFDSEDGLIAVLEMTDDQWKLFTEQWHKLTQHPGNRPIPLFSRDPESHRRHRQLFDEWTDTRIKHIKAVERLAVGFGMPVYTSEETVFVKWLESCGVKSLPFVPRQNCRRIRGA